MKALWVSLDDKSECNLQFLHARFINEVRTSDYQTTRGLREIIERDGNLDDIKAFLMDRNLPVDEIALEKIAEEILRNPPPIGYLTISNALQWRLQYSRVIDPSTQFDAPGAGSGGHIDHLDLLKRVQKGGKAV